MPKEQQNIFDKANLYEFSRFCSRAILDGLGFC